MDIRKQNAQPNRLALASIGLLALVAQFVTLPAWAAAGAEMTQFIPESSKWHAVVAIGGGAAFSSDVGVSHYFPIINPVVNEFYDYDAKTSNQTKAVFEGFLGAEWQFHPAWAVQFGVAYDQQGSFAAQGNFLQGADVQSQDQYTYNYRVLTRQILAEGKLLYTVKERIHPYALLGLGAAIDSAYDYGTNVPPFLTFTRIYANNTQASFAYNLGAGVDVDISSNLRFGLGYRFADLGAPALGPATINGTRVPGTLSGSPIYSNEVLAQLTFRI